MQRCCSFPRLFRRGALAVIFTLSLAGFGWRAASAATLYDANVGRKFASTDSDPLYYNVGADSGPGRIMLDDVPVNYGGLANPSVNVTRVMFDISRQALSPATVITAYYAAMLPDALQTGNPDPNYDSTAYDDPAAPVQFGSISLAASASTSHTRTTISFGNGVSTLFTVPLNTLQEPGAAGYFFVGLNFTNTDKTTGWTIADPGALSAGTRPDSGVAANGNLDVVFDYGNPTNFAEFTYPADANGVFIVGSQMMKVEGNVVPEPVSLGLITLVAGAALAGRPRR